MRSLISFLIFATLFLGGELRAQLPENRQQIQLSYAPLVKEVAPAVVNVFSQQVVETRSAHPFSSDPFFRRFMEDFGFGQRMRKRVQNSLGSGVIVDPEGMIVSNAHVVGEAGEIIVMLADGREFEAELVLKDDASDLALLKIDPEGEKLPFAELKPSEELAVGDLVLAIGNPFGVGQTVTSGIVSALARSAMGVSDFNFFIQTDAAVNPGNSGGPLVAMDGGVVGINTAIYSRSGGSLGIGFAIPSEMVATLLGAAESGQINDKGIIRPWLGVSAQDVTSDLADNLGLDRPRGALISTLHPLSPARDAGLKKGDVILGVNGTEIRTAPEAMFRYVMTPIGETAQITYWRDGKTRTARIRAIAPPEKPPRNEKTLSGAHPLSGATIANLSPAVAEEVGLGLAAAQGVVVMVAERGATASKLGLQQGDIIRKINRRNIKDVADVITALNKREPAEPWILGIERDGEQRTVVIR